MREAVERHEENKEAVFINLLRKPSTAIEAIMRRKALGRLGYEIYLVNEEEGLVRTL